MKPTSTRTGDSVPARFRSRLLGHLPGTATGLTSRASPRPAPAALQRAAFSESTVTSSSWEAGRREDGAPGGRRRHRLRLAFRAAERGRGLERPTELPTSRGRACPPPSPPTSATTAPEPALRHRRRRHPLTSRGRRPEPNRKFASRRHFRFRPHAGKAGPELSDGAGGDLYRDSCRGGLRMGRCVAVRMEPPWG